LTTASLLNPGRKGRPSCTLPTKRERKKKKKTQKKEGRIKNIYITDQGFRKKKEGGKGQKNKPRDKSGKSHPLTAHKRRKIRKGQKTAEEGGRKGKKKEG